MKTVVLLLSLSCAAAAWCAELDARLALATSRCTAFAELLACADALNLKPNDATLLMAEGDALVRQRRPGEAIGVYRNAARQSGGAVSAADKIANAEAQRLLLLESCETGDGDSALRACEAAWLPGARDEAALFERRGYLLQLSGQLTGALDAYMAAARLRPADRSVAQAIVTLSDRSGRNDAATLSAQGQALLTLGRPTAALLPLRRALMLSPTLAEARSRLRIAERRAEIRTAVVAVPGDEPAAVVSQPPRFTNEQPLTRSN